MPGGVEAGGENAGTAPGQTAAAENRHPGTDVPGGAANKDRTPSEAAVQLSQRLILRGLWQTLPAFGLRLDGSGTSQLSGKPGIGDAHDDACLKIGQRSAFTLIFSKSSIFKALKTIDKGRAKGLSTVLATNRVKISPWKNRSLIQDNFRDTWLTLLVS